MYYVMIAVVHGIVYVRMLYLGYMERENRENKERKEGKAQRVGWGDRDKNKKSIVYLHTYTLDDGVERGWCWVGRRREERK